MTEEEVSAQLHTLIGGVLKRQDLKLARATTAADVDGWDSLSHVQIMAKVEGHFKIKLALREIMKLKNFGDLVDVVRAKT